MERILEATKMRRVRYAVRMSHATMGLRKVTFVPLDKDLDFLRRRRCKRAALANQKAWRTFVTLTYDDAHVAFAAPAADMREFINRMRNTYPKSRARMLRECTDLRERSFLLSTPQIRSADWQLIWRAEHGGQTGRIHIHIMSTGYIPLSLWHLWRNGARIDVRWIYMNSQKMVARYLSKYMSKGQKLDEIQNPLPPRARTWGISRGMKKFIPQWVCEDKLADDRDLATKEIQTAWAENIRTTIRLSKTHPEHFDDLEMMEIVPQAVQIQLITRMEDGRWVDSPLLRAMHNRSVGVQDLRDFLEDQFYAGPPCLPDIIYKSEIDAQIRYEFESFCDAEAVDWEGNPIEPIEDLPVIADRSFQDPRFRIRLDKKWDDVYAQIDFEQAMKAYKASHGEPELELSGADETDTLIDDLT